MKLSHSRIDCQFISRGMSCKGWLYLPEGAERPPVIIMAHGFACEKDFRLPVFAQRFVEQGLAVFLFDYRYFGESEGWPRNLVDYRRQLEDWEAAISFVQTIPEVNAKKMALWGTSYSGGHVISVAAKHPELKAVSAHVPFTDGISSNKTLGISHMLKLAWAGIRDGWHMLAMQRPYCIPVVAKPGNIGCMNSPGSYEGYLAIVPKGSRWKNEFPARVCLIASFYRPISAAKHIQCPVLIIMGENDSVVYTPSIHKMAAAIPDCKLISMSMGHFDSYQDGELFEKVIDLQSKFLCEKLLQK